MLCLPDDVPAAISAIENAIEKKRLDWKNIEEKLVKVLEVKYHLGLNKEQHVETINLVADLNKKTDDVRSLVARNALTVLRNGDELFPLQRMGRNKKVAYVDIGASEPGAFGKRLQTDFNADVFSFSYQDNIDSADSIIARVKNGGYSSVIISFRNYNLRPANNFYISATALTLWSGLQSNLTATILFGNVYAAKNFCTARNLVAAYQDDDITQEIAADFLLGRFPARGWPLG